MCSNIIWNYITGVLIFLTNDVIYLVIYFNKFIINFYLAFRCSDVMCWMLEGTVTNKKMTDIAKKYIKVFSLSFVRSRQKSPKQVMPMCLLLPTFALKSPGKMVIVEMLFCSFNKLTKSR